MFKAHDISKYVINWCHNNDTNITNLKLQKLLYFIQGEYYRITNERLIDDDFYAWQLGPVIPEVYSEYSIYSSSTLPYQNDYLVLSNDVSLIIDCILKHYAYRTTWDLVDLSHKEDPWKYTHEIFGDKSIIPYDSIKMYYKRSDN